MDKRKIDSGIYDLKKQGDFTAIIHRKTGHKELLLTKRFKKECSIDKSKKVDPIDPPIED